MSSMWEYSYAAEGIYICNEVPLVPTRLLELLADALRISSRPGDSLASLQSFCHDLRL